MNNNIFIGITGGIGSGKSTVSRFWSRYAKLPLIDIDELCRELLEVEMPGWYVLKEHLGDNFFGADGQLDRAALRSAVFDDEQIRNEINRLVHPLALDLFHERTEDMQQPVLVDVPLLFEAGWEDQFQHTIVVYTDQQTCCGRVAGRDNVTTGEASKAIIAQKDLWEKAMLADHVIDNRYDWLRTSMQVTHLAKMISQFFS